MTQEFLFIIKSAWHLILPFIIFNMFAMYAVTESVNMDQDNVSYDDNFLHLIPRSRVKQSVIMQNITYRL